VQKHRALHLAALQQQMAMQAGPPAGPAPTAVPTGPESPAGVPADQL